MNHTAIREQTARDYFGGRWVDAAAGVVFSDVHDPATGEVIGRTPLSDARRVAAVAESAAGAFATWRRVPATARIQYLFKLKALMEERFEDLARAITIEHGKTLAESRAEVRRGIENVEMACGIPMLMQGEFSEDVSAGIDEFVIRQPLGVCACVAPFNFPLMIAFWFLPYAIACGNTFIVKPSERVPFTMQLLFELIDQLDLPPGVLNLVNGGREAVDAILEHPAIRAVSFVGSTAVAKYVYATAAAHGKRAQCQGGAKNPVIILPDCDLEMTTRIVADSAFGCTGQRCLAASLAITVGEAHDPFRDAICDAARARRVGPGLDAQTEMGPVISSASQRRVEGLIRQAQDAGARLPVDGRSPNIAGAGNGFFVGATIIDNLEPGNPAVGEEIFGPALGLMRAATVEEAIALTNSGRYGNMACIFTTSGAAARKFRSEADVGNVGINIGVAAPMAFFPFSGWKDSFFGDLHGQARHAVEFFTQTKVVIERWPKTWSRRF